MSDKPAKKFEDAKVVFDGETAHLVDGHGNPLPKEFYDILAEEIQKEIAREIVIELYKKQKVK